MTSGFLVASLVRHFIDQPRVYALSGDGGTNDDDILSVSGLSGARNSGSDVPAMKPSRHRDMHRQGK